MSVDSVASEELTQIQCRNPQAIELLVKTYTEPLYKAGLGLGFHATQAEELVQNVWATFFEVAPKFQGRSKVKTFIFGILYNKASDTNFGVLLYRAKNRLRECIDGKA